jgi:hypothetical protein
MRVFHEKARNIPGYFYSIIGQNSSFWTFFHHSERPFVIPDLIRNPCFIVLSMDPAIKSRDDEVGVPPQRDGEEKAAQHAYYYCSNTQSSSATGRITFFLAEAARSRSSISI